MQSTNRRQIKAALWDQAFIGNARVSCLMGRVVAIGKCPETLPDFALKHEHLPRILDTRTNVPGKSALHQVYSVWKV